MYLLTPMYRKDVTQGQFYKLSLIGLNSEFSFWLPNLDQRK